MPVRQEAPTAERVCHDCHGEASELSRCEQCRVKRRPYDTAYHAEIAEALFPARERAELLRRIAGGEHLSGACEAVGVSVRRAQAYGHRHPEWAAALDQALMQGRDPDLAHGTEHAYRHGRCRCPECREAKNCKRA